jgi:NADH dehydrogenase
MSERLVTIFGGTGFLGRHLVERLRAEAWAVRVAVRQPERAVGAQTDLGLSPLTWVATDVRDPAAVARALEGASAAINAVGHYREQAGATFDAVHVAGARTVAGAAAAVGVERLIHVSGIGADKASSSSYVRARAVGEAAVRATFAGATILRPSVLFGPGDAFIGALDALARVTPVLPLFGAGDTRLQPVFVGDVAAAAARALATPGSTGRLYELGGPRVYTYRELLKLLLARSGRRRLLLPVPFVLWRALAAAAELLPRPPVSEAQVTLMSRDNLVAPEARGLADLAITPTALESILPGGSATGEGR